MNTKIQKLVLAALLAAFTTIATMIIKLPTPTMGYIHLGDALVLLCGIILGPISGGIAAGIGSMFADLFSGYVSFAPATLIIKAATACICGFIFHKLNLKTSIKIIISSIPAELIMVLGYFLYEIFLSVAATGNYTASAIISGAAASIVGVPFNILQGIVGIAISLLLVPILSNVKEIQCYISE